MDDGAWVDNGLSLSQSVAIMEDTIVDIMDALERLIAMGWKPNEYRTHFSHLENFLIRLAHWHFQHEDRLPITPNQLGKLANIMIFWEFQHQYPRHNNLYMGYLERSGAQFLIELYKQEVHVELIDESIKYFKDNLDFDVIYPTRVELSKINAPNSHWWWN